MELKQLIKKEVVFAKSIKTFLIIFIVTSFAEFRIWRLIMEIIRSDSQLSSKSRSFIYYIQS